jgi:hypothetical protein
MRRRIDIDRALADPNLLGAALGDLTPWKVWRVVLKAAFALGLGTATLRASGVDRSARPSKAGPSCHECRQPKARRLAPMGKTPPKTLLTCGAPGFAGGYLLGAI